METEGFGLVADIGRQSVRFGITQSAGDAAPRDIRSYQTSDHATFTSALLAYIKDAGLPDQPIPSMLAIAGAARGDLINLTGSRWYISLSGVEAVLRTRPRAINECAATALALTALPLSAFTPVGPRPPKPVQPGGNYLVVTVGTGLGVAALVSDSSGRLVPVASEAGHMAFAPSGTDEEKFAAFVRTRGQASAETLLSAAGITAAYTALSPDGRVPESPEEVTRSAGRDQVSGAAVRMFVSYLGAFIGDVVLAFGAWDGVYLTGPITKALHVHLNDARFRHRLEAKDAFRRQLSDMPVALVNRSDLELLGAATALRAG